MSMRGWRPFKASASCQVECEAILSRSLVWGWAPSCVLDEKAWSMLVRCHLITLCEVWGVCGDPVGIWEDRCNRLRCSGKGHDFSTFYEESSRNADFLNSWPLGVLGGSESPSSASLVFWLCLDLEDSDDWRVGEGLLHVWQWELQVRGAAGLVENSLHTTNVHFHLCWQPWFLVAHPCGDPNRATQCCA